jgi:hypothetical protein
MERKAAPAPLSSDELQAIQEGERYINERQQRQRERITQEDKRVTDHFTKLQRYVITNQ